MLVSLYAYFNVPKSIWVGVVACGSHSWLHVSGKQMPICESQPDIELPSGEAMGLIIPWIKSNVTRPAGHWARGEKYYDYDAFIRS